MDRWMDGAGLWSVASAICQLEGLSAWLCRMHGMKDWKLVWMRRDIMIEIIE